MATDASAAPAPRGCDECTEPGGAPVELDSSDTCPACHVWHGGPPCPFCDGTGYHDPDCPECDL